jgi:hypothetical protein
MDNIAKLVLGTVAFIGLLVLIIPEGNPLPNKPGAAPASEAPQPAKTSETLPPPPPAPAATNGDSNESTKTETSAPEMAPFGQPMLDPTPPGARQANQQGQNNQEGGNQGGQNGGNYGPVDANGDSGQYTGIPAQPASGY